ncbi:MAG: 50S ribosomal protein L10 [Bacteroidota bacterium]
MTQHEKHNIVEQLAEKLAQTNYFYIIDATGLTVAQTNDFRRKCHQEGITYQVVKNTLISKALSKLAGAVDYTPFHDTVLKGFSGILIAQETANIPAKIIQAFRKEYGLTSPLLKGASIDSDLFVGEEHLAALSSLKSKQELIGEIIGLLQSPVQNVMAALQSGKEQLAGLVKTLATKEA